MDGIRFILEDPHAASSRQKKRSRLVTACDTCRAKKIKCHQSPTTNKCEACKLSKSPCRFRDRERYHAQRSGSISGSSSSFNSDAEEMNSAYESPRVTARRATLPTRHDHHNQSFARSSSLPPALPKLPSSFTDTMHRTGSPSGEVGPHRLRKSSSRYIGPLAPRDHHAVSTRHSTPSMLGISPHPSCSDLSLDDSTSLNFLFDPLRPGFPSYKYMHHAVDLFFDNLGTQFPFLRREDVFRKINEQTITAPLANCIAALALRFSHSGDVLGNSRDHLGDPYIDMAKELIMPVICHPSVETLHSLLMLSWTEYGSGRESGLSLFHGWAVQMAMDMGLGRESNIRCFKSEQEQIDLRLTWWSIVRLDITYSWVTGNPVSLKLEHHDTMVPAPVILGPDASDALVIPYERLHDLLGLRDQLLNLMNSSFNPDMQNNLESEIQDIRTRLATFQMLLPPHLEFNIVNLRKSVQDRQSPIFVFLHCVLQTLIAITHAPSLFRPFQNQVTHSMDVASSAARNIFDIVILIESLDSRAIAANPYLDFPLAAASRIFLVESGNDAEYRPVDDMQSSRSQFADITLSKCTSMLTRLAGYWGNVRNVEMNIEQRSIWTFNCAVQRSPPAMGTALGLQGMDGYPHIYSDSDEPNDLALTYSDSDLSREPSPLLFDFPSLLPTASISTNQLHYPSSDPTPTRLLPPVSFASGEFPSYDGISNYAITPYSEGSSAPSEEYFSMMSVGDCLPSEYENNGRRNEEIPSSYPHSPWSFS